MQLSQLEVVGQVLHPVSQLGVAAQSEAHPLLFLPPKRPKSPPFLLPQLAVAPQLEQLVVTTGAGATSQDSQAGLQLLPDFHRLNSPPLLPLPQLPQLAVLPQHADEVLPQASPQLSAAGVQELQDEAAGAACVVVTCAGVAAPQHD